MKIRGLRDYEQSNAGQRQKLFACNYCKLIKNVCSTDRSLDLRDGDWEKQKVGNTDF